MGEKKKMLRQDQHNHLKRLKVLKKCERFLCDYLKLCEGKPFYWDEWQHDLIGLIEARLGVGRPTARGYLNSLKLSKKLAAAGVVLGSRPGQPEPEVKPEKREPPKTIEEWRKRNLEGW